MYIIAVIVVIILLLILLSPIYRSPSVNNSTIDTFQVHNINYVESNSEYCPYRAIIGRWRTKVPNAIPAVSKEYEFSTMENGKTILLRVRHVLTNPPEMGGESIFTRGSCILTGFKCNTGFTGDVMIEATCASKPSLLEAPLDNLPRMFNVVSKSNGTVLIDMNSSEEFHKYEEKNN